MDSKHLRHVRSVWRASMVLRVMTQPCGTHAPTVKSESTPQFPEPPYAPSAVRARILQPRPPAASLVRPAPTPRAPMSQPAASVYRARTPRARAPAPARSAPRDASPRRRVQAPVHFVQPAHFRTAAAARSRARAARARRGATRRRARATAARARRGASPRQRAQASAALARRGASRRQAPAPAPRVRRARSRPRAPPRAPRVRSARRRWSQGAVTSQAAPCAQAASRPPPAAHARARLGDTLQGRSASCAPRTA